MPGLVPWTTTLTGPATAPCRLWYRNGVRFGLWYDFRNPPNSGRSTQRLYRETLDQIVYAEELGYHDVWLSEHHFVADGYLPSCLPVAAAIARSTERISIGTSIVLLPFHHPIRLAEDAAVVDVISDGRFTLGVAVGYRLEEFATFGVDRRHRGRSPKRRSRSCDDAGRKTSSPITAATSATRR
jgi:alkanesulfonate monooxygenase SsuD/methylene tetrahydromethanopterin reductase-like flavin-dependent oxidoreductase (luciferase family)